MFSVENFPFDANNSLLLTTFAAENKNEKY